MSKQMFWLGIGVGFVITSLILGLMTDEPAIIEDADETQTQLFTSVDDLRKLAEQRGYVVVSNSEWKALQEVEENAEENPSDEAEPSTPASGVIYIYVPEGFSWEQTADVLEKANIVSESDDIIQAMREMGRQQRLQSGLHMLQTGETPRDIVDKLSRAQ